MSIDANKRANTLVRLRYEIQPGDLGEILRLHGVIYGAELGFDYMFEGYVAQTLGHFSCRQDKNKERLWIAEEEGKIVGCIGIIKASETKAQLRWLLVHPIARGQGLGHSLLGVAIEFALFCGYSSIFLQTVAELPIAVHMYTSVGFVKTHECKRVVWEKEITEQEYELQLK
ncbi:MAG: GNAT family N-acetyltransferase [Nostocaceae cyanobacterium]|nr:GNAT family N-acetyltransferase [Nostocaceae cyanobacterium]